VLTAWLAPHKLLGHYIICLASHVGISDNGAQGDDAQDRRPIATLAGAAGGYLRCSTRQASGNGADARPAAGGAKKGKPNLTRHSAGVYQVDSIMCS